jgi:peroxiredoxin
MKNRCITVCLILLFGIGGCIEKPKQETLGKAVEFQLMDTDSTQRRLVDFKDKIIMLHFWADWCPHCRQEFPELQNAYENLREHGLNIVGINSGQSFDHVIGIEQEFNLTFPMLVDESASVAEKYKVSGLPSSIFIDSEGTILAREVGWMKEDKIQEIFNRLLSAGSSSSG